jgi:hypothetical protein
MDASQEAEEGLGQRDRSGLMRREWRNVLVAFILFLLGTSNAAARQEIAKDAPGPGGELVRLTLEVSWGIPRNSAVGAVGGIGANGSTPDGEFVLKLSEGRVIDAVTWPPRESRTGTESGTGPGPDGTWRLGKQPEGRVRVRVESPLDAVVVLRGGDQPQITLPLLAILEKPQHTPPQSPLIVSVERVAWDSLAVDLGEPARDGIVAPGTEVPVSLGFNILWPESAEVAVRTTAVVRSIRGGDELGHYEPRDREVVATNRREPSIRTWSVRAPRAEGTYVLEVSASWVSTGAREGSVLGRFIRRHRPASMPNSAVRRVVFTVVDPAASSSPPGRDGHGRETEVDAIDLTRSRSYRPLAAGHWPAAEPGRFAWPVPAEALIEPSLRDRLRGWFKRTGAEASKLDPANASGLAWSAMGLKVAHPERPHRLTLKVRGGEPAALGVALIEPGSGGPSSSPRLLLDACASGPPILQDGQSAAFSWLVWPSTAEMVLVLINRSPEAEVRLGMVTLTELDELPQLPRLAEANSSAARTFGLYLTGPDPLEPFGGNPAAHDAVIAAQNLVRYLGYCGASAVVLPETVADRSMRRALDGYADEDSTGPDRLEVIRRVLSRQGFSLWLELDFDGPNALPGLPPADSPEAARRGLVRVDRQGRPDAPEYHPLHPEVREAMKRRVIQALTQTKPGPGAAGGRGGLLIRLGPGPTLLGTPDTGLDDATFDRFVRESFSPETARGIPGLGETAQDRFDVRSRYLAGKGRMPWLTWRSRAIASLYTELAETAQAAVPGSVLAVVTPGLDEGPAGDEARRVDRAGLAPSQAWRSVGLDLQAWPGTPAAPPVFRGVVLSTEALGHDLATSPDLDALVAGRAQRGVLLTIHDDPPALSGPASPAHLTEDPPIPTPSPTSISSPPLSEPTRIAHSAPGTSARNVSSRANTRGVWLTALPLGNGPAADEPLGHAIAALDARWVFVAQKAVAGQEERLRRFAGVLRALPAWPAIALNAQADLNPKPFGVAVRRMSDDAQTFLEIANDSPYPIRLAGLLDAPGSAPVEDLGRGLRLSPTPEAGGRNLVLDLLPYGVAAIRVGAPRVQLSSVTPYPSEAVLTTMQSRFNELSAQLARLNHGIVATPAEPANPGFEPATATDPPLPADSGSGASKSKTKMLAASTGVSVLPAGWRLEPNVAGSATIAIDGQNAHLGQGSLRLTAPMAPSSVISESFVPNVQSSLDIQVFLRASGPGFRARVWIEGESAGKPYVRRTELDVSTAWESRTVRASDIPAGGIDKARLRFELMTPGTLWIDDLHIRGETTSTSSRINAQRTLLAALQAYREQRYDDFARLAGSHWIRESATTASGRLARTNDLPPDGTGGRTKR